MKKLTIILLLAWSAGMATEPTVKPVTAADAKAQGVPLVVVYYLPGDTTAHRIVVKPEHINITVKPESK